MAEISSAVACACGFFTIDQTHIERDRAAGPGAKPDERVAGVGWPKHWVGHVVK